MFTLERTEAISRWVRHQTWTQIEEAPPRSSALQNQFALWEFKRDETEAVAQYRGWLWEQMQNPHSVVAKEMRMLARAHLAGEEVTIYVPENAAHGETLLRALEWFAANLPNEPHHEINTSEPAPCYDPLLAEAAVTMRTELDAKDVVWVIGNREARIGVIVGWNEVLVPGFGVITLKDFSGRVRWANEAFTRSPILQEALNDGLDLMFEAELATPVAYDPAPSFATNERFEVDEWDQSPMEELDGTIALAGAEADAMTQVEQLAVDFGDIDTALEVVGVPDIEDWYAKRPPLSPSLDGKMIRTVYMHKGDNSPLMVKSPEDQLAGKRFRYAKKAEAEEYIKTHRPNPNRENEASNTELHYQVIAPHCSGRIVVRNGFIVQTSPILEWAFKSDIGGFRSYCKHMRWELREIKSTKALLASRPGSHP